MEKCVTDPSITNVLMLLDPVYASKADKHTGGVGTETQIISPKVYQEVTQDKFIPVIMKRDDNGNICKPTYLQGRLHFDLSIPEEYDATYQRLVRSLFGIETYQKPQLGSKPDWVDRQISPTNKILVTYDAIKRFSSSKAKEETFSTFLDEISKGLLALLTSTEHTNDPLLLYEASAPYKTNFVQLLGVSSYVETRVQALASFFEETANKLPRYGNNEANAIKTRLHELFLYCLAFFLKKKDYSSAGYFLRKTYFNKEKQSGKAHGASSFTMFYSGSSHEFIDSAVKQRDNKNYYSGTAQLWIDSLISDICTKEQFVFADLICFNYCIYGRNFLDDWTWFPITYVYDNEYDSSIGSFAQKLVSREHAEAILPLFGFDSLDDFIAKVKEVESSPRGVYSNYRYQQSFNSARYISEFIRYNEIGKYE